MFRRYGSDRIAGMPKSRPAWRDWLLGLALLVLFLQFGIAILTSLQHAGAAVAFPYPLEYQEGLTLDRVLAIAENETVYRRDLTSPPFTVVYQTPLFWLLQVPFFHLFGPAFWYGRALSTIFIWLAAVFIGLSLFTLTRDWVSAIISGTTLLAFPYILQGSVLNQPDSLALALSWAGLFVVLRLPERQSTMLVGAVLFTMAIYTRQTYFLAAPLAGFAWLLHKRLRRQALTLLGLVVVFCLAAFLLINLLTRGGFYYTLFAIDARPFSWITVAAALSRFLPEVFYLLVGTLLFLVAERYGNQTQTWPLLMPYFLGALLASSVIGQQGTGTAAFFEIAAAFSLAAGAVISWVRRIAWLNALLVLLLALQVSGLVNTTRADILPLLQEKSAQQNELKTLYQPVQQADGLVLADTYAGMVPLSGHALLFQPVEFKMLEEAGRWNNQPIIAQLNQKSYRYILLHIPMDQPQSLAERWSPEIRSAIYANYHHTRTIASVYLYEPLP